MKPSINILVALPCEAKPLINYYQLAKDHRCHYFSLFRNKDRGVSVCVSKIGKLNMAAAVAFLQQYCPAQSYLNVGIAGSLEKAYGDIILANKICDVASGKNYFPSFGLMRKLESATVYTHDSPVNVYPESGVVEMEASGFFSSCAIFLPQELVQVMKIISDTCVEQQKAINTKSVEQLVSHTLADIDKVVKTLLSISQLEPLTEIEELFKEFVKHWHFTYYQQNELKALLRRWLALALPENPVRVCDKLTQAKAVLAKLQHELDNKQYMW